VPICPADEGLTLHVLTGHVVNIFGIADIMLDFGQQIKIRQKFIVCDDELFLSRTGILGLDFLEDNGALIDVREKRMQLQGKWINLSSWTKGPSALFVVRNRKAPQKTERPSRAESRDESRGDPDHISPALPKEDKPCSSCSAQVDAPSSLPTI